MASEGCDVLLSMADELIQMGEVTNEDEWELLCSSEVDYDTDDDLERFLDISSYQDTGTARPNAKSSQDSEAVRIRYRYVGNPNPQREF